MNERMNESEKRAKSETLNTKKVIIFGDDKFLCAIDGFMMETNYVIDSRDLPTDVVWLWIWKSIVFDSRAPHIRSRAKHDHVM